MLDDLGAAFGDWLTSGLASLGRVLLIVVATLAFLGLGAALMVAGLLSLLGFKPGDVARVSPPGRAATVAEFALGGK